MRHSWTIPNPLLELAREILGSEDLGSAWFELGGSSIDAARMVSRARVEHGAQLALVDLLRADSVAGYLERTQSATTQRGA
jgi:hypothetical protein